MERRITLSCVQFDVSQNKKDGGSYQCAKILFVDETGQSKEKPVANAFLEKKPELMQQLRAAVPNTSMLLLLEMNGQWENFVGIIPDDGRVIAAAPVAQPRAQYQSKAGGTTGRGRRGTR